MKYLLTILLFFYVLNCNAAIYQQEDNNGQKLYSDFPLNQDAKPVSLETPIQGKSSENSASTPLSQNPQTEVASSVKIVHSYSDFSIASPKDQETFQNQRYIPVEIKISPELQTGDKIQIYLDGKPAGPPVESVHVGLAEIERGTHQLSAALVSEDQQTLKQSQTITIYIHYANLGTSRKSGS